MLYKLYLCWYILVYIVVYTLVYFALYISVYIAILFWYFFCIKLSCLCWQAIFN